MIALTREPIDYHGLTELVRRPNCGAVVTFLGTVRDLTGDRVTVALDYEGYPAMAEKKMHAKHFPQATLDSFSVLMVTTTENRRDLLAKAIAEKPGAPLWRFACVADLTPEKFLSAPIWHRCDGQVVPLVKPAAGGGA